MWLVKEKELEDERRRKEEEENGPRTKDDEPLFPELPMWKKIWYTIVYDHMFHGILLLVIFAIAVPLLVFIFLYAQEEYSDHTCDVLSQYQIPCGPNTTTFSECEALSCCFNDKSKQCFHTVPSRYQYTSIEDNYRKGFKPELSKTPFGKNNIGKVYLGLESVTEKTMSFSLSDTIPTEGRLVPLGTDEDEYEGTVFTSQMGIEVKRKVSQENLLSTSHGPAIVSDRYWEWTIDLYAQNLYGLNQFRFQDDAVTSKIIYSNSIEHGVIPKFMAEKDGKFHGLVVDHSGPLEITVLPSKLIVIRMLSGFPVKFHLSVGPTPADVLVQQQRVEAVIPPYWAMGVHVCRDGNLKSVKSSIREFETSLINAASRGIPFDSDCIHENLFSLTMNTMEEEDTEINVALNKLRSAGKKFLMSLSPQLNIHNDDPVYKNALSQDILYQEQGTYLGKRVAYPDYGNEKAKTWVADSLKQIYAKIGVEADGYVLRNNWPVNERYTMQDTNQFQYLSEGLRAVLSNTIPWNAKSPADSTEHMARHNIYGSEQASAVYATKSNLFVLSASFSKENPHGAHVQNMNASWVNFKRMLTETLSHSLFGTPLRSTPVCGATSYYSEDKQESLCVRWYLAAVTLPIFRISSELPRRDPTAMESLHLLNVAKNAIKQRYRLLPYYYTMLLQHRTLIRPMFMDFYEDNKTLTLDEQYMVGDAVLVAQPVLPDLSSLSVYLPNISGGWYEFWGGIKYDHVGWVDMPTVETSMVMFIAAGKIIPLQNIIDLATERNAEDILKNLPLSLLVALDCSNGTCSATGSLSLIDGEEVLFEADELELKISNLLKTRNQICKKAKGVFTNIKIYQDGEVNLHFKESPIDICDDTIANADEIKMAYTK